ncbi:KinB sensor domain-containing domain [Pseudomonas sp. S9]|uniref:KinB sensor domain-containing domain n=1 Tax=Pseudomonas sp. S9 TaxID=686578 RepID=UPI00025570FC|nr:KinB sensor domain-containing domain [Pseudomonas sp. S9]
MKLRTRLFVSGGALLTVALIGLILGMVSVWQITRVQNQAMNRNLDIIDATIGFRQEMGTQVILLLEDELDPLAIKESDIRFRSWLAKARRNSMDEQDRQAITEIARAYALFGEMLDSPANVRRNLLHNDKFTRALQSLRDHINAVQLRYVAEVQSAQQDSRERATVVTALLGLIGLALLVIGFITGQSIARRVARPIESLASAADQIGQGDLQISLPQSPVAELAALSRRFCLMADSLRQFKNSNVAALMAEQQRLQAVLDSIDDGLLMFDRSGLLEHFNPVAGRQLDWTEEHIGESLDQALGKQGLDEQIQRVLQGKTLRSALDDLQIIAHGEERLLSYSLTPVSQEQGGILGAVMVLRDVTKQRVFERVRSDFVLRASHELRTPVTGMHMAFALLQERLKFDPQSREADLTRTVDEQMQRLVDLIADLLNFSRYQSGVQKLELAPCNLSDLVNQTEQRFAGEAAEKGINLRCEAEDGLPEVPLDRAQMDRVLDNLMVNALRHTASGGEILLNVQIEQQTLIICVQDDGDGVLFSQQSRIFEPFVQVGKRKGGVGLGLALCKEIVQLHGGHISLESKPGEGALFCINLPIHALDE